MRPVKESTTAAMPEQDPPSERADAAEEQAGTSDAGRENDESWLPDWSARYEEERQRSVTKTVRFYPDEWGAIEKRAARAGMAPATYMRLRLLGEDPDAVGLEAAMAKYCALGERILDLILQNPVAVTYLAEAVRLRDRLEELHRSYCLHGRGDFYEPPPGVGEE